MSAWLIDLLSNMPAYWRVFFLSMVPITELRVAIPLGISWGLDPLTNYLYAVLGNILPILPILFFLKPVFKFLSKNRHLKSFIDRLLGLAAEKTHYYQRYALFGLSLFVSIPAPGTGAWSGSLIAYVLQVDRIKAFLAISLGVLIVGGVMTVLSLGLFSLAPQHFYAAIGLIALFFLISFVRKVSRKNKSKLKNKSK